MERTATVISAEEFALRRAERERLRQQAMLAFEGSILAEVSETEKPASEPIGETAKWLKQILTP
jgi:hypothetical protein